MKTFSLALAYIFLICRLRSKSLFLMEVVVPRYLHCSTIGIFDLPREKDGELTFNSFLLYITSISLAYYYRKNNKKF